MEMFIWYICVFGTAGLFYFIGAYAGKKDTPMRFWAGTEVEAAQITDVRAYNRANGRMWKAYSAWYWIAGILPAVSWAAALAMLFAGASLGLWLLVHRYRQIEKEYRVKQADDE